ncbi:lasso peptide biosynthesis B2 protein [Paenibacillus glycanilyticus]|uniref:lasso peptide biosynthesis B2 protein n=1 Tax=Paenibacillus glycanilyticus TaxID=126569 RepID=UPI0019108B43|nr:lasso peptide biosynthesis B2 protein [Paenibacillus glycanilyticus]
MGRLRKFISSDRAFKFMLLEAFFYLGWARILKAIPFAKVAPSLGKAMRETSYTTAREDEELIHTIARSIRIMSRYTLWESKCLVMAIACMKMLEKRRVESTLYLGTMKNGSGKLSAHAWLRTGPYYVTGAEIMERYTVVGIFGKSLADKKVRGE